MLTNTDASNTAAVTSGALLADSADGSVQYASLGQICYQNPFHHT